MAGLTLTFPVMMLFGAFGVFVGAGHAAVLSIKLGENDFVSCEKLVGELIALKLLFFFILPPQIFRLPLLREAYKLVKARGLAVTDEVSAVEAAGVQTRLVQVGANMKITLPGDLELAELIWKHRA